MMGENALPLDLEDRVRAIQIVGSASRRFVNAIAVYLVFALPSLVMATVFVALEFGDIHPMDPDGTSTQLGKLPDLVLSIITVSVPNFVLIWLMYRVQTKSWWRRLIVQPYFRRALQVVVVIRLLTWFCFMFVDTVIGMFGLAVIAIPMAWIGDLIGVANLGPDSLGIAMYLILSANVIATHLLIWGGLMFITSAITSGVMKQAAFPCLWCGHEQSPTGGDRCPECGISFSESEARRAKARGIYQPHVSDGSATNDFENPPSNA